MTAIGRLIHRYAIWIVGVWALAAIIGNNFAPPLEQVITAEDQPFSPAGTATSRAVERSAAPPKRSSRCPRWPPELSQALFLVGARAGVGWLAGCEVPVRAASYSAWTPVA